MKQSDTLSAPEAAALLGVSVITLHRWDDAGILPSQRTEKQKHRRYNRAQIMAHLRQAAFPERLTGTNTFIFDFDSTLFPEETLEQLLAIALRDDPQREEKNAQIEAIGQQGMEGAITVGESIERRLACAQLRREHIQEYVTAAAQHIDPAMQRCLQFLRQRGQRVLVVSNGFRECIHPLAALMEIPATDVFCSRFHFSERGAVLGPCQSPLMAPGGKADTVWLLRENGFAPGYVVMLGDGISDLQVYEKGYADAFIGCGFYRQRPVVKSRSLHFCTSIRALENHLHTLFP